MEKPKPRTWKDHTIKWGSISGVLALVAGGGWLGVYPMAQDAYGAWKDYLRLHVKVCELGRGQEYLRSALFKQPFTGGPDTCAD